jgi:hypothetical protein
MTQTTVPEGGAQRALSLPERLIGAIFSPRATFESVAAHPVWLTILVVTTLLTAAAWFVFLSTDVGQQAAIDQQFQQREAWGQPITPDVERQINASGPFLRYFTSVMLLVMGPIMAFAIAGVLFVVFAAVMGGGATYKQTLAVVAHAGVVPTLVGLAILPLNYARSSMSSATNLGVFVQMLPEDSFLVRFFGMIDLMWIWYLVVLAIGLGVLYRRKTSSIAIGLLGVYLVIALAIAAFRSSLGGS